MVESYLLEAFAENHFDMEFDYYTFDNQAGTYSSLVAHDQFLSSDCDKD